MLNRSELGVVILAAGLGKRMKSNKAKVLHAICGFPMIHYVVRAAAALAGPHVVVVVGHQAEQVRSAVVQVGKTLFAFQEQQNGTGHAVLCAMPMLPAAVRQVVILCGDVPLIRPQTIQRLVDDHVANRRDLTLLAVRVAEPKGYGRVVLNAQGQLSEIVEEADANEAQKKINAINSGIYVVERGFLESALPQLNSDNAQREIYLTDIIGLGYRLKRSIGMLMGNDSSEIIGVNSREDLQRAEEVMRLRSGEKS